MDTITITHTHADGTVVHGDPRPHHGLIKDAGFTYRRTPGWFIRSSRDKNAQMLRINQAAQALRDVGFTVEVEIDNERRDVAQVEADRVERNAGRVEALEAKSERKATESDATLARARELGALIPIGQPILVGHHSEKRHRNHLAKIDKTYGKAFEAHDEAQDAERKARAAEANQAQHESLGTTLRRIEKLEASQRDIERKLASCKGSGRKLKPESTATNVNCPWCFRDQPIVDRAIVEHGGADGNWRERLLATQADQAERIEYWKAHVASLEANGVKVWGPADFKKDDVVLYWGGRKAVLRVNKKSVTVQSDFSWTDTIPYDKVEGREDPPAANEESDA